jgi:hypothetical protein
MNLLPIAASTVAVLTCLATTPVTAQERGAEPPLQLHAVNPSMSLSAPTNSPVQQQMREDYAASLRSAQKGAVATEPVRSRPAGASDRARA